MRFAAALLLGACGFQGPGTGVTPRDAPIGDPADAAIDGRLADATVDGRPIDAGPLPDAAIDAPAVATDAPARAVFAIEAEDFNSMNAVAPNTWSKVTDTPGYRGSGLVLCGPQTGGDITFPLTTTSSLTYTLTNAAAGMYYVHLRMWSNAGDTDSIDYAFDASQNPDELDPPRTGQWVWITSGMPTALAAGDHAVTLYRRECGARVDQVRVDQTQSAPP